MTSVQADADEPAWRHGHAHEPNPAPPHADPTLICCLPDGRRLTLTPDDLARLPQTSVAGCVIASTGHPPSGPFTFGGVRLVDLLHAHGINESSDWAFVDVVSDDGFGTRVDARETQTATHPILLATTLDGAPLRRDQGLVRLIVPGETDDALRQVKWVSRVEVH